MRRHFEDMLELTSQVVYLKRSDGAYLFVNREFERVSGVPRSAILGKKDREIFPPLIADLFAEQDRQVVAKRAPIEFDETITLPGGPFSFITTKFPLFDEKSEVCAIGGSCVDVTARLRSEALLAQAEALAGIGSFEMDVASRKARRSPGLYRVYGVTPADLDSCPESIMRYVHPDDRERFGAFMRDHQRFGTAYSTEYRIIRPDGQERLIHVEGHAKLGDDGRPIRVYGWIQDVTERRALETKILSIADRERRSIGQDLHDDLGQRLTGIAFMTRALEQRLGSKGEREAFGRILKELEGTIAGLRELARGLQPVATGRGGLARSLRALASNVAATSGVDCRFVARGRVSALDDAVANQLYRIAQEALHNAVRHGKPRRVEIALRKQGRDLELSVIDDGRGMTARPDGPGMGLSIMRHRASLIHGALSISARLEGGTVVSCVVRP